eukprot:TRINITY_DN7110_c0_g1_i1.p1 TRINITY_DN7110_c0_g1~~TRINITY_DN7110_c0_g1_i1.p1  ORF type:complete len:357 (+),score=78.28 TRINITY_DN7110_c0_g1_i1:85-1155(+)
MPGNSPPAPRRQRHLAAVTATAAGASVFCYNSPADSLEAAFLQSSRAASAVSAQANRAAVAQVKEPPMKAAASRAQTAVLAAAAAAGVVASCRTSLAGRRFAGASFASTVAGAASTARPAAAEGLADLQSSTQKVKELVDKHDVIVFSKTTCPFCTGAKGALEKAGKPFHVFELDELPNDKMQEMQDALCLMTGARTVPRVFVKGQCLGGCDDVLRLQDAGKLVDALSGSASSGFEIQKSEDEWKKQLSSQQYYVLRQQGTEPPGSHEYNRFLPTQGHFACGACGFPLYSASSKFRSSCGWPVFDKCYFSEEANGCHVGTIQEFGGLEIVCNRCASHLGHVFFDAYSARNPNGERH